SSFPWAEGSLARHRSRRPTPRALEPARSSAPVVQPDAAGIAERRARALPPDEPAESPELLPAAIENDHSVQARCRGAAGEVIFEQPPPAADRPGEDAIAMEPRRPGGGGHERVHLDAGGRDVPGEHDAGKLVGEGPRSH